MNRVVITEQAEPAEPSGFAFRHPLVAYLFGDMVRGLYVLGCLALDLLAPLQVHLSYPAMDLIFLPPLVGGLLGLTYVEYRAYRRLWPPSRRRRIVEIVEGKMS